MEKEYWAVCEVAVYLGVSDKFVYRNKEAIPGLVRIGSLIRFHVPTLKNGLAKPAKRPPSADNKHGL